MKLDTKGLVEKSHASLCPLVNQEADNGVIFTSALSVKPQKTSYALKDLIPFGALTVLGGAPGLCKSTLALLFASDLSRGRAEGDAFGKPVDSVISSVEDSAANTIIPRLIAAGADLSRIHLAESHRDGLRGGIVLPDDLGSIAHRMEQVRARFLVIDPLMAHLSQDVNSWRDQDIRRTLGPLAKLAEELGIAVLVIVHLNKNSSQGVLERMSASMGIVAAARSVLLVAADPEDPASNERFLAHVKCNVGPIANTRRCRVEEAVVQDGDDGQITTSVIRWLSESTGVTASDLLALPEKVIHSELEDAKGWLESLLSSGPKPAEDIFRQAERVGISKATLQRAKNGIGIKSEKIGFAKDTKWCWKLKESGTPYITGDLEHLRGKSLSKTSINNNNYEDTQDEHLREHLQGKVEHLRRGEGTQRRREDIHEGDQREHLQKRADLSSRSVCKTNEDTQRRDIYGDERLEEDVTSAD